MSGMNRVSSPSRMRIDRLPMASLCRLNRRQASWRVLRTRSWIAAGTSGAETSVSTGKGWVAAATRSIWSWSRIADPRVENGVQDVGSEVEDDHEEHGHHHPGQDLLVVPPEQGIDEVPPHPRIFEDGLGDDQAPGDGPH